MRAFTIIAVSYTHLDVYKRQIQQRVRVDLQDFRVDVELVGHLSEVRRDLAELLEIHAGVAARALECRNERLGRRLGGAVRERGQRAVDDVDAGLQMCIRDRRSPWWTGKRFCFACGASSSTSR